MKLVIVESPTKAKTLRKFLGNEYIIEASMGHVRDLPKSKLGVDVKKNFEPEYEVSKGKSAVISTLKKAAEKAEHIFLATDPDREGEAISWHIQQLLQQNGRKKTPKIPDDHFSRVTFHEITKTAIEAAVKEPGAVNLAMFDAQQARRVVDRLVGYTLSPVLWRKIRRGLSAGRVQSVAVRLIVEREREIKAFIPEEYWEIGAEVAKMSGEGFFAALVEVDGKKIQVRSQIVRSLDSEIDSKKTIKQSNEQAIMLSSKEVAEPIVEDLKLATYTVTGIERKEQQKRPYAPFITSTLQQAAANVLGWSGKMTMQMAQQLYEAGLITYHRTDSVNLAAEAVTAARAEIATRFGSNYVPEKAIVYVTKSKNAQEAHEAIRPTRPEVIDVMTEMRDGTDRHQKLYQLIWRRFMSCQMKPAIYDQTSVVVRAQGSGDRSIEYKLRANGSVVKFDGWRKAYEGSKTKETDVLLPAVTEKEDLLLKKVVADQKYTEPKPRYNDASLVKELEKRGIGRPSTYASILSTIVDRGYVERLDKRYSPTSIGEAVNDFLVAQFAEVLDYQFTAEMEDDLDSIARGEKDWGAVMKTFWTPFEKAVKAADSDAARVEIPVEKTGEKCPKCGVGELVIRTGKFGKFLSCGTFPTCDYKASLKQTVVGVVCPTCGGEIVQKRTRTGRTFWGCATYPKCTWASWQDPSKKLDNPEGVPSGSNG